MPPWLLDLASTLDPVLQTAAIVLVLKLGGRVARIERKLGIEPPDDGAPPAASTARASTEGGVA